MKTEKHDRRSERAQRLLANALVDLMQTRSYADLTVQDILDHANIGRSTFYAHYWDKEDLLTSEVERMLGALLRHIHDIPIEDGGFVPSLGLFRHIQEQYRLYQALVRGDGFVIVLRTLRRALCAAVEQRLADLDVEARTVTAQAMVGTLLALLQWWLETEMALSPERLDAYYRQLVLPGVQAMMTEQPTA